MSALCGGNVCVCVCARIWVVTVVTTLGFVSRCQRPSALLTAAQRRQQRPVSLPHTKALFVNVTIPAPKHSLISLFSAGNYFHNVSCQTTSHMTAISLDAVCQHTCELSVKPTEITNRSYCKPLSLVVQEDAAFLNS